MPTITNSIFFLAVCAPMALAQTSVSSGSSLPGTCAPPAQFNLTSGSVGLYNCAATNTWVLQTAGPVNQNPGPITTPSLNAGTVTLTGSGARCDVYTDGTGASSNLCAPSTATSGTNLLQNTNGYSAPILNTRTITGSGLLSMTNPVVTNFFISHITAAGVNVYTASTGGSMTIPSGKLFMATYASFTNTTATSITACGVELVSAGTLVGSISALAGSSQTFVVINKVFNSGDQLEAFCTGSTIHYNTWLTGYMYDVPATGSPTLYTPRLTGTLSSTNTLYTVPANTTALVMATAGSFSFLGVSNPGTVECINSSGTPNYTVNIVPSGGSVVSTDAANSNIVELTTSTPSSSVQFVQSVPGALASGDCINVNVSSTTGTQACYVTVLEIPN